MHALLIMFELHDASSDELVVHAVDRELEFVVRVHTSSALRLSPCCGDKGSKCVPKGIFLDQRHAN